MERVEVRAESRKVLGKKVKQLRADGWIPAVLYGPDTPSRAIQVGTLALLKALSEAGSTALIDLYVDQEPKPNLVLARDLQQEPVTGRLQHVDFFQVRLTEKVKTSPRIEVVGESPLVQSGGAVLVQILDLLEVECLPTDLISSIQVDVSGMDSVEDSITVSELPIPPTVTVLADPDDVVVSLVPPRMARVLEEITEEEAVPEEVLVEEVELEEVELEEEAEPEA